MIKVRPAVAGDSASWLRLRGKLWPDGSDNEHGGEIARYFRGESAEPLAVLVAEDSLGRIVGFAELSIRPCAEGCRTSRIGYLEGWYVEPERRRQGVGRSLLAEAERWARSQGCTEFASDTEADNDVSTAAHQALGFVEAGILRCFRKEL
ncbi:MAG: aminoglycoside 6'-N-acetyltransferase [Acidobacteriota bacterium]